MKKLLFILISVLTIGAACTAGCENKGNTDTNTQRNGVERSVEDEYPDCDEDNTDKIPEHDCKKKPRMPRKIAPNERLNGDGEDENRDVKNPRPVPMPHPHR